MKRMRFTFGALIVAVAVAAPAMAQADDPAEWRRASLLDRTVSFDVGEIIPRLVTIEGNPNPADDRTFDIAITVAEQKLPVVTVYTGGRVPAFRQTVGGLPLIGASVHVGLEYRFDPSQYVCAAGLGTTCVLRLPVDALHTTWVTQEGPEAGLFLTLGVTVNELTVERQVSIPLAGQVLGMVTP